MANYVPGLFRKNSLREGNEFKVSCKLNDALFLRRKAITMIMMLAVNRLGRSDVGMLDQSNSYAFYPCFVCSDQ